MSFSAAVRDALIAESSLPAREDLVGMFGLHRKGWFMLKTNGAWYCTYEFSAIDSPLGVVQPIVAQAEAARGSISPDDAAAVAFLREAKQRDVRSLEDGPNGRVQ